VDLNLLVDHHPQRFLSQVSPFLDQVTSTEDLNLFISALKEEDTAAQRYPPPPWYHHHDSDEEGGGKGVVVFHGVDKQNRVCELIREGLVKKRGWSSAQEPILSTYAKQDPPRLEEALDLINKECQGDKHQLLGDKGQKLIKYLGFFTKVDPLYNTALGLYLYDLVRAVARQSQKDPKEYLPYLDRLQNALPQWRARWEIDLHLGRYVKALNHVAEQEEGVEGMREVLEDCLVVIESHELQEDSLSLFSRQRFPAFYQSLLSSNAARLMKKQQYREAMMVYLDHRPPLLLPAAQAAKAAGMWRQALNLISTAATTADTDTSKTISVDSWAQQIAKDLHDAAGGDKAMIHDAGVIKVEYLGDIEAGVMNLCEAWAWVEATSVCCRYGRRDLLVTDVYPAVRECQEGLVEDFRQRREVYEKVYAQWVVAKDKAEKEEEEGGVGEHDQQAEEQDETQSQYSGVSGASEGSLISRASTARSAAISVATSLLSYRSNHPGMVTTLNGDDGSKSSFKVEWGKTSQWGKGKKKREKGGSGKGIKKVVSAKKEAEGLLADLRGMVLSTRTLEEVAALREALVVQADGDRAKELDEVVEALVDYCHTYPLPFPPEEGTEKKIDGNLINPWTTYR